MLHKKRAQHIILLKSLLLFLLPSHIYLLFFVALPRTPFLSQGEKLSLIRPHKAIDCIVVVVIIITQTHKDKDKIDFFSQTGEGSDI